MLRLFLLISILVANKSTCVKYVSLDINKESDPNFVTETSSVGGRRCLYILPKSSVQVISVSDNGQTIWEPVYEDELFKYARVTSGPNPIVLISSSAHPRRQILKYYSYHNAKWVMYKEFDSMKTEQQKMRRFSQKTLSDSSEDASGANSDNGEPSSQKKNIDSKKEQDKQSSKVPWGRPKEKDEHNILDDEKKNYTDAEKAKHKHGVEWEKQKSSSESASKSAEKESKTESKQDKADEASKPEENKQASENPSLPAVCERIDLRFLIEELSQFNKELVEIQEEVKFINEEFEISLKELMGSDVEKILNEKKKPADKAAEPEAREPKSVSPKFNPRSRAKKDGLFFKVMTDIDVLNTFQALLKDDKPKMESSLDSIKEEDESQSEEPKDAVEEKSSIMDEFVASDGVFLEVCTCDKCKQNGFKELRFVGHPSDSDTPDVVKIEDQSRQEDQESNEPSVYVDANEDVEEDFNADDDPDEDFNPVEDVEIDIDDNDDLDDDANEESFHVDFDSDVSATLSSIIRNMTDVEEDEEIESIEVQELGAEGEDREPNVLYDMFGDVFDPNKFEAVVEDDNQDLQMDVVRIEEIFIEENNNNLEPVEHIFADVNVENELIFDDDSESEGEFDSINSNQSIYPISKDCNVTDNSVVSMEIDSSINGSFESARRKLSSEMSTSETEHPESDEESGPGPKRSEFPLKCKLIPMCDSDDSISETKSEGARGSEKVPVPLPRVFSNPKMNRHQPSPRKRSKPSKYDTTEEDRINHNVSNSDDDDDEVFHREEKKPNMDEESSQQSKNKENKSGEDENEKRRAVFFLGSGNDESEQNESPTDKKKVEWVKNGSESENNIDKDTTVKPKSGSEKSEGAASGPKTEEQGSKDDSDMMDTSNKLLGQFLLESRKKSSKNKHKKKDSKKIPVSLSEYSIQKSEEAKKRKGFKKYKKALSNFFFKRDSSDGSSKKSSGKSRSSSDGKTKWYDKLESGDDDGDMQGTSQQHAQPIEPPPKPPRDPGARPKERMPKPSEKTGTDAATQTPREDRKEKNRGDRKHRKKSSDTADSDDTTDTKDTNISLNSSDSNKTTDAKDTKDPREPGESREFDGPEQPKEEKEQKESKQEKGEKGSKESKEDIKARKMEQKKEEERLRRQKRIQEEEQRLIEQRNRDIEKLTKQLRKLQKQAEKRRGNEWKPKPEPRVSFEMEMGSNDNKEEEENKNGSNNTGDSAGKTDPDSNDKKQKRNNRVSTNSSDGSDWNVFGQYNYNFEDIVSDVSDYYLNREKNACCIVS